MDDACGHLGSPHILLRSGVGPPDELREAGVSPTVDLPAVGRNLRDHVALPLSFRMRDDIDESNVDGTAHPMPMHLRYTATPVGDMEAVKNDMLMYLGPMQSQVGEKQQLSGMSSSGARHSPLRRLQAFLRTDRFFGRLMFGCV